ncbi:MAG: hypothetical protein ACR2OF_08060, partial [Hyphomicrobium sp.]
MMANRRRHPRLSLVALVGALAAIVVGGLILYWPVIFEVVEHRKIRAERWNRWMLAMTGQTLPGTPDLANLDGRLASQDLEAGAP